MRKRAGGGLINDAFGASLWGSIPFVGGLIEAAGALHGLIKGPASEEALRRMDKHPGYSYIPGVGTSRLFRKYQSASASSRERKHALSELLGWAIFPTLGAGIGAYKATRGYSDAPLIEKLDRGISGAVIGAGIGSVPTMLGFALGNLRRNRSSAEQAAHDDNKSILANLLIPGVAGYNAAQRMRGALREEYKRNENPTD